MATTAAGRAGKSSDRFCDKPGGGGLLGRTGRSGELEPSGLDRIGRGAGRSSTSTDGRCCMSEEAAEVSGVGWSAVGPRRCATSESSSDDAIFDRSDSSTSAIGASSTSTVVAAEG